MNIFFIKINIILVLCILVINGDRHVEYEETNDLMSLNKYISELVIPEIDLTLLDEVKSRNLLTVVQYGKRNKETAANSTSATTPASSATTSSGRPCSCSLGVCKCCTGLIMDLFNQKACMRVTYHPGDFAFDVAMSLNDRILYENSMSGKNPRPICVSAPRIPNLKFCGQFYNVFFPGRNFHFCLAMKGLWRSTELFNLAFDCLRMGANGIAMVKPDEEGGIPVANPLGGVDAVVDVGEDDIEDYDENLVRSLFGFFDR